MTGSAASALAGATAVLVAKPVIESVPIPAVQRAAESISIALVVIAISYLFLVLAELVPKALAIRFSEKIALWFGAPTWWLLKVLNPFANFLSWSTNLWLRLMGISAEVKRDSHVTEEEVKIILKEGLKGGVFEPSEHELIHAVFEFADIVARNAMTPRTEIVAIAMDEDLQDVLTRATAQGYSRMPIYDDNLDSIKGIIHTRDLLNVFQHEGLVVLKDIMRPVLFVPDSKKISEILKDMQRKKTHMAIVLDEFGGTAGLITLEDILEEIVGEIQDEYDAEEGEIIARPDGSLLVMASVDADHVCERLGVKRPPGDFESISGMVMHALDRIPSIDETIEIAHLRITVIEKDGHRVKRLKVERLPVRPS